MPLVQARYRFGALMICGDDVIMALAMFSENDLTGYRLLEPRRLAGEAVVRMAR
jgi:hypothetical protein